MEIHALRFQDSAMDIMSKLVNVLPVNLVSILLMENAKIKIVSLMQPIKYVQTVQEDPELMLMEIASFQIQTA